MKFIDLNMQYQAYQAEIDEAMANVLQHGKFIHGPECHSLEEKLSTYVGVDHCIGCSNGTSALLIALMALDIRPGDEVITVAFSYFATAEVIMLLGAKPVFIDVDEKTYNIDPELIEAAITPKTKAIIAVSLYGQCADFDRINAVAAQYTLPVIEDAAQSFGATYKGKKSGALSTISTTSFFPSKPLGCYGDGGALFTDDAELAEKIRMLANHGQRQRYQHECFGMNARLDTLQAAVLLVKLAHFDDEVARRQQVAAWYQACLADEVQAPYIAPACMSVYGQYTILVENRDKVTLTLTEAGIPFAVHYPIPIHKQPAFLGTSVEHVSLPVSERLSRHVLSLPFYPFITQTDVKQIAGTVANACELYVM